MPSVNNPFQDNTPTQSDVTSNTGMGTFSTLPETTQDKLASMVRDNPEVIKDPSLLFGFAHQNDLSSTEINNSIKYLTMYGGLQQVAMSESQRNAAKTPSAGFWGSLVNGVRNIWDTNLHRFENMAGGANQSVSYLTTAGPGEKNAASNVNTFSQGVSAGSKAIGTSVYDIANRTALTATELLTAGAYGPNGWNMSGAGLSDAADTINNAVYTTANSFNLFSSNNIFQLMSHTMAFYQSLANRYGWSYALAYATPSIAAGFATDGLTSAAGDLAEAEGDASLFNRLLAKQKSGGELTEEEKAEFEAANRRLAERERMATAAQMRNRAMTRARRVMSGDYETASSEDAQIIEKYEKMSDAISDPAIREAYRQAHAEEYESALARMENRSGLTKVAEGALKGVSKVIDYTNTGVGSAFRVAKILGKPMSDVKLNASYLTSQMLAQSNPETAKIWNDPYVREGVVIGADGRPIGTSGQMLAQYFGIDKGNMFFSPVSGLSDFYTKWLGTDPLGAYGHILGEARSYAGFTGKLGEWYGGLGVKSADDIYRANQQYSRVRKAFQFMATHNAAEIADTFRNTYVDDTVKGITQAEILNKLGEAKSVEEVMKIHADIAESVALVKGTVPTLTTYEVFKAALKGELGKRFGILGNLLTSDGAFLDEVSKQVLDETGIPVKPNSELLWVANDQNIRGLNSFARWLATRFTRSQMYIDDLTKAVENYTIRPGSVNAIPAIMDMLRSALMPEEVVKGVGDLLLKSKNPQEYINAYRQAVYHAVMRRATAGLNHAEMSTFIGTASDHIWDRVVQITGLDGGGNKGLYVAGINGEDLSAVYGSESKIEGYAGLGSSHLGELHFPRVAELRGLANEVRGFMQKFSTTAASDFTRARKFDVELLERVVKFNNPSITGLANDVALDAPESIEELKIHGDNKTPGSRFVESQSKKFFNAGGRIEIYNKPFSLTNESENRVLLNQHASEVAEVVQELKDTVSAVPNLSDDTKYITDLISKSALENSKNSFVFYEPVFLVARDAEGKIVGAIHYIVNHDDETITNTLLASWGRETGINGVGPSLAQKMAENAYKEGYDIRVEYLPGSRGFHELAGASVDEEGNSYWSHARIKNLVEPPRPLAEEGYNKALDDIREKIEAIDNDSSLIQSEKFVRSYDMLRVEMFGIQSKINLLGEMIRISKANVGKDVYAKAVNDVMESFPEATAENAPQILADLMGQKTAYRDAVRNMEIRMSGPSTPLNELRKEMNDYLEAVSTRDEAQKILKQGRKVSAAEVSRLRNSTERADIRKLKLLEQMGAEKTSDGGLFISGYQQKINEWELIKNPYLPTWQKSVDGLNRLLNKTFVPLALLSGGWALRVSASEAMLNTLRFGGWESFDAKIVRSIAKHEISATSGAERSLIRDVVAGALLGLEKALVSGMDEDKKARMLDDFVGTIMRYDGHLPMGVHSTSGDVFNDKTIDHAGANTITGIDSKGRPVMSQSFIDKNFASTDIGAPNYITALMGNIKRISYDSLMQPTAQRLADILYEKGEQVIGKEAAIHMADTDVMSAGAKFFRTPEEIDVLREQLEETSLQSIEKMDPAERARYQRDTGRVKAGSKFARNNAHEEWAAAISEHVIASVSGEAEKFTVFHTPLVEQAATGDMKAVGDFTRDVHFMPKGSEPKHVPSPGLAHRSMQEGYRSDFIKRISDEGHEKVLGPIVNKLVREPIFLLEQHNAMEVVRDLVDKGIVDRETAEIIADQRAMTNMIKYVHNPKDKTLWEENMRIAAPFYFAQNQAWRRAFRVMRDNPGAFEKYLKLSLGVTNYISKQSTGGAYPSVAIPGSQFMGMVASAGTEIPGMSSAPSAFNDLGFGLSADPGSVSSVFPTGAEGGIAGALGLARPSWGPLVTVPIKLFEDMYGVDHHPLVNKVLSTLLGPISSSSSVYSDLLPSTVGRNAVDLGIAVSALLGTTWSTDALNSTENYVINNAIDNLYTQQVQKIYKNTDFSGINPSTGQDWTRDEIYTYCRGQADQNIANLFDNHEYYQQFLDHAHAAAIAMTMVKAVISFGSPVAVSVQEQFGQNAEFQKILDSKDPQTGQKYTYDQAVQEFVNKYPNSIFDLVAHSSSVYSDYPETTSALRILNDAPWVANNYPNAAAYLINRNSQYSPSAYSLEVSLGLRAKEAPQDYLNSVLVAAGNDYYYNYLSVQPQFGGNGRQAGTNIAYEQYTALAAQAKQYGRTSNPTWYNEFTGATRFNNEVKAFNQMKNLLNDKSIPSTVLSSSDRSKFKDLMNQYEKVALQVQALKEGGDSSDASLLKNEWYQWCTNNSTDSYYSNQSYFMTSVLRGLPTV